MSHPETLTAPIGLRLAATQSPSSLFPVTFVSIKPILRNPDAVRALETPHLAALGRPVPHAWLLPRCAAILHAGGAGTVAAALLAGVPQVVCPLHFDQPAWVSNSKTRNFVLVSGRAQVSLALAGRTVFALHL